MKQLVGLFGNPIGHSASPAMHNAVYPDLGLDWTYMAFPISEEFLPQAIESVRALGMPGANVTVPYKEAVLPFLDEIAEDAKMGSVNTIVNIQGRLVGHSTDGPAFFYALREVYPEAEPFNLPLVIVGAGGAARAIAGVFLAQNGPSLTLYDSQPGKAASLVEDLCRCFPEAKDKVHSVTEFDPEKVRLDGALLVNATPVGMWPKTDAMPFTLPSGLAPETIVADIIYNPEQTELLKQAAVLGYRGVNGVGMLVWQAALAIELWCGQRPDTNLMEQALLNHLRHNTGPK